MYTYTHACRTYTHAHEGKIDCSACLTFTAIPSADCSRCSLSPWLITRSREPLCSTWSYSRGQGRWARCRWRQAQRRRTDFFDCRLRSGSYRASYFSNSHAEICMIRCVVPYSANYRPGSRDLLFIHASSPSPAGSWCSYATGGCPRSG